MPGQLIVARARGLNLALRQITVQGLAMQFGLHLLRRGLISADDFADVLELQLRRRSMLGAIAIESRLLSMHQLFSILSAQAESAKPFGRVAVELGYLSEQGLRELLGRQCEQCLPVSHLLVEKGILSQATVSRELQSYHKAMVSGEVAGLEYPTGHTTNSLQTTLPLQASVGKKVSAKRSSRRTSISRTAAKSETPSSVKAKKSKSGVR